MSEQDLHDQVVAAVEAGIVTYLTERHIKLSGDTINHLAHRAANAVPPNTYREGCSVDDNVPCACTGACIQWFSR